MTLYRLTTQKGEFEVVEGKKKRAHVKERRKGRSNKEEERRRAKQGKGNIKRKNRIKVFGYSGLRARANVRKITTTMG